MLNEQQKELKDKLKEFINSNENGYYGILGAGGTGKTYTVCKAIEDVSVKDIIFLGATNKVVNVLRTNLKTNYFGVQYKCKTVDSFLGFRLKKDHENKTITSYKIPSKIPKVIIIDEVSLINNKHFEQLQKIKDRAKFILIGDDMQIPPIEDKEDVSYKNGFPVSKIFNSFDDDYTLTIQQRQKEGTGLYDFISGFRDNMHLKMSLKKIAEVKSNGIDIHYYEDYYNKDFKKLIRETEAIAVGYKNLTCLSFNWLIGSTKANDKGYKVNNLNIDDKVYFDSFYIEYGVKKPNKFYTSDVVKILDITENKEGTIKFNDKEFTYPYKELKIIADGEITPKTIKVSYGSETYLSFYGRKDRYVKKLNKELQEQKGRQAGLIKKKMSEAHSEYSDFMNGFAKLKKPYAITSHKAQGSTYDNVIIPIYDFYNVNHKKNNQLLYVALSRAKKNIIFVNRKTSLTGDRRKTFSELEKMTISSTQNNNCNICNKNLEDNREMDIDHITPLARGGDNNIKNLQALCKSCHKRKTKFDNSKQK